ncbi:hypothetical protein KPH14_003909 [Odynerus spinipes]|uniref:Uncharacterized protein n=1 Tax=Odynerus spinipes TaxID=1348599 RepID=A0AAD9VVM3_9HYME|nr:hypothetical protein KPH14_003909 [Odynerus spinipes]
MERVSSDLQDSGVACATEKPGELPRTRLQGLKSAGCVPTFLNSNVGCLHSGITSLMDGLAVYKARSKPLDRY